MAALPPNPLRPIPHLSDDIIVQILKRVSVKDVLRCKTVCKPWLEIIRSQQFVRSQLRHALGDMLTLISHDSDDNVYSLSLLDVASPRVDLVLPPYLPDEVVVEHHFPRVRVVGSANGLVCIMVFYLDANESVRNHIFLWNPATRRSKLIPSDVNVDGFNMRALAFGYDSLGEDYKILRVVYQDHMAGNMAGRDSLYYEVYSESRGDWRRVRDPAERTLSLYFNASVNGIICGFGGGNVGISAFNLNNEELITGINQPVISDANDVLNNSIVITGIDDIEGPEPDGTGINIIQKDITEFNGSIALVMFLESWMQILTWTLNDDECLRVNGVAANWTPLFSIDIIMPAQLGNGFFFNGRFEVLLRIGEDGMWISCDVDNREANISQIQGYGVGSCFHKYAETLVSLPGFTQIPD